MSQLLVVENLKPIEVYNSGNIDNILNKIAEDARSQKTDMSTEKGRKSLKSDFIAKNIQELESIDRDWQEFKDRAANEIQKSFEKLDIVLKNIKKYEDSFGRIKDNDTPPVYSNNNDSRPPGSV